MVRILFVYHIVILSLLCLVELTLAAGIVIGGNTGVIQIDGNTVTSGCVQGSGVEKSVDRELSDFTEIILQGAYDVKVVGGSDHLVTIRGDDNIINLIKTNVDQHTLTVTSEEPICPQRKLQVHITLDQLSQLTVMGTMDVAVKDVDGESLNVGIEGSASVAATGTRKSLTATIGGNGSLQATDLRSENAQITVNGIGNAYVYVTNQLDVNIQGIGNVYYSGNPAHVNKTINGIGTVVSQ